MPKVPSQYNLEEENFLEDPEEEFVANNRSGAKEAFRERSEYRDDAYPLIVDLPKPIDIWYNRGLYGKVDEDYNTITNRNEWVIRKNSNSNISLTTAVIKQIPSDGPGVFAMNFVVDAFVDLRNHMYNAANRGQIAGKNSSLVPLEAKRGWSLYTNNYSEYFQSLYQGFSTKFLERNQAYKNVNNFRSFMGTFSDFTKEVLPDFPLSTTGYVMSKYYSINQTGLVIELADEDHGDDKKKYEDFITDINFLFFAGAARKFGFFVDKNAPWRLVADIKSEKMQQYMSRYPELPPKPKDPVLPKQPCDLIAPQGDGELGMFKDFLGEKLQFTSPTSEMINNEWTFGRLSGIRCGSNPADAEFLIETYCPGSDVDLFEGKLPPLNTNMSVEYGDDATYNPHDINPRGVFIPRVNNSSAHLSIVVMDPEDGLDPMWANTRYAGERGGQPVSLEVEGNAGIDEFKWRIVTKPSNSVAEFVYYDDPQNLITQNSDGSVTSSPGNIDPSAPNKSAVRFRPDVAGEYAFEVRGINYDDPITPRIAGYRWMTMNVCSNTSDDIRQPPPRLRGRALEEAFYWLLTQEINKLLGIWNRRKAARVSNIQAVPPHIAEGDMSPWFFNFLTHLKDTGATPLNVNQANVVGRPAVGLVYNASAYGWGAPVGSNYSTPEFRFDKHIPPLRGQSSATGVQNTELDYAVVVSILGKTLRRGRAPVFSAAGALDLELAGGTSIIMGNETIQDHLDHFRTWLTNAGTYGSRLTGNLARTPVGAQLPSWNGPNWNRWFSDEWNNYPELRDRVYQSNLTRQQAFDAIRREIIQERPITRLFPLWQVFNDMWQNCPRALFAWEPPGTILSQLTPTVQSTTDNCNPKPGGYSIPILLNHAQTDSNLKFILLQNDNYALEEKRKEYAEYIMKYPSLEQGYQEQVIAMDYYNEQKELHQHIHNPTSSQNDYGGPLSFNKTMNTLFKVQYDKTKTLDIERLKNYILDFYNSYVIAKPMVTVTNIKQGGQGTQRCFLERDPITFDEMMELYPDFFWADFYFALRTMESRKNIDPAKLKTFKLKAKNILTQIPPRAHPQMRKEKMQRIINLANQEIDGALKEKMSLTKNDLYDIV